MPPMPPKPADKNNPFQNDAEKPKAKAGPENYTKDAMKPKDKAPPSGEPASPDMAADIMLEAESSGSMKSLEDALSELGRSDLMPADVMAAAQNHMDLDKMDVDELAAELKKNPDLLDELDIQTAEEEPSGPYKAMPFDAALRDMTTEKEED